MNNKPSFSAYVYYKLKSTKIVHKCFYLTKLNCTISLVSETLIFIYEDAMNITLGFMAFLSVSFTKLLYTN